MYAIRSYYEQSAKALRGGKMEDVIFNGTQLRKALAYSEVTLTFDNTDGLLKVPFTEVAITRRVYRSGESEYCINRNNCRLRDISDLFCDTGIRITSYNVCYTKLLRLMQYSLSPLR